MTGWVEDLEQQMAQLTAAVMANSDELARVVADGMNTDRRLITAELRIEQLEADLAKLRRNVGNLGRGL